MEEMEQYRQPLPTDPRSASPDPGHGFREEQFWARYAAVLRDAGVISDR